MKQYSRRRYGDYVAAAGVILGLVFVGLELRQNTAAVRGAVYQELTATSAEVAFSIANDPELTEIYVRWLDDAGDLDRVERLRLDMLLLAYGRNVENAFQQQNVGTMVGDLWEGYIESWRPTVNSPGFPSWWESFRVRFSSEFQEFVDTALVGTAAPQR